MVDNNEHSTWKMSCYAVGGGAVVAAVLGYCGLPSGIRYTEFRTGLFSGLLSMVGFTLTIKSFLIVNLAKTWHESETVEKVMVDVQAIDPSADLYAPLTKLKNNLMLPVVACLWGAVAQYTLGLADVYAWAVALALGSAVTGLISLVWAIDRMQYATTHWLDLLRRNKNEKLALLNTHDKSNAK